MSLFWLAVRSATYYWRTNLAVLLGVAAAVAVLGGALLVGDSVRGSLRDIALGRLGRTDQALSSAQFFRTALADDLSSGGPSAAPLIVATSFVTHGESGRRAGGVIVYGVDERFWTFHGVQAPQGPAISPALGPASCTTAMRTSPACTTRASGRSVRTATLVAPFGCHGFASSAHAVAAISRCAHGFPAANCFS